MAETQGSADGCVVGKPCEWVADSGDPGGRQYGDRSWFKNGSTGLSKIKYLLFSLLKNNYLLCIMEF